MRSRYTAYTIKREPYLLRNWHVSTRPGEIAPMVIKPSR